MVELIDEGYQFAAQELMPVTPSELLPWLWQPELMKQWMPGVDAVEIVDGNPGAQGCLTAVTLSSSSRYASLGWRLTGRIDQIGPTRLVRTYSMESMRSGVIPMTVGKSEYMRTVSYDLAPVADAPLVCAVRTVIPGLRRSAARAGGKAEAKSLHQSLKLLTQLSAGQHISWVRRAWTAGNLSPQAL